jgi:hypothetical protein
MVCKPIIQFQPAPDSFSIARNLRLLPRFPMNLGHVRRIAPLNSRRLGVFGGPWRDHQLSDSQDEADNDSRNKRDKAQDNHDFQGPSRFLHCRSPLRLATKRPGSWKKWRKRLGTLTRNKNGNGIDMRWYSPFPPAT